MIIRSQDKEIVINFNQVVYFRVGKRINKECDVVALYSPFSENDCGFVSLGEYSPKEKAIKVLDMICEEYVKYTSLEDVLGGVHGIHILPKCFQMPQDEEV